MTRRARALGALQGLAIGDALGMPTQLFSRAEIARRFGRIAGFLPAPPDHPIAAGMPAGAITDDTEQALLLAQVLIEGGGRIDPLVLASRLVAWEERMRERGSLDLLGPSTRAAVTAVVAGASPEESGRSGATNGAAMRIAPIGVATPSDDLARLVDAVEEASRVTHHTGVAVSGAAAVAAAVSAGVDGASLAEALEFGVAAARLGAERGNWVAGASVADRIEWAVRLAGDTDAEAAVDELVALIGSSLATQESVPLAFGLLAVAGGDGWRACCAAASAGGDTDTVGAMAGAIAGAVHGESAFPAEAVETVVRVNGLELDGVAERLLELRDR